MVPDSIRSAALSNALGAVTIDKRFPENVFLREWDKYLFFEESILFEMDFLAVKNLLIEERQASVIALVNLRNIGPADDATDVFYFDADTNWAEYRAKLRGDGSPDDWLFLVDRYVCASDVGTWCIYCEKEEDIAVIAFRNDFPPTIHARVATLLNASSVDHSPNGQVLQRGFDFGKLISEWRSELVRQYRTRPS